MAVSITHAKVSGKPAGTDPDRVYGTHWDADHTVPVATAAQAKAGTSSSVLVTPSNLTDFYSGRGVVTFETRADVIAASINSDVEVVITGGHTSAGDLGGAQYKRVSAAPSHNGYILSGDGTYWELIGDRHNAEVFGVRSGSSSYASANDTAFSNAIAYLASIGGGTIHLGPNDYYTSATITIAYGNIFIRGTGQLQNQDDALSLGATRVIYGGTAGLAVFFWEAPADVDVQSIVGGGLSGVLIDGASLAGYALALSNVYRAQFSDIYFKGVTSAGIITTTGTLTGGYATATQFCNFSRIYGHTTGSVPGIVLTGGGTGLAPTGNTAFCRFENIDLSVVDGYGVDFRHCDNITFDTVRVQVTGTGKSMRFLGTSSVLYFGANSNTIIRLSSSEEAIFDNTYYPGGNYPFANKFVDIDSSNGTPAPTMSDGSAVPAAVATYNFNDGIFLPNRAVAGFQVGGVVSPSGYFPANTGYIGYAGSTSGVVTVKPSDAAGTYNFNLPTSAGTSGQPLLSGGGGSTAQTYGTLSVGAGGTGGTSASGTLLDNITGFSSTGQLARTASGTYAFRTLTAPAAGISVSNGDGVSGNPTLALANDLSALEALSSTGLAARTGSDTWAQRTLTAPAAGITVSNGDGVSGNPTLALANDLSALEGLGSTGLAARTASDTWAQRTITGTSNQIGVTDGNGVSGNPTLALLPSPSPTSYTPTVSSTGGSGLTTTSVAGHYTVIGKQATVRAEIVINSIGSATGFVTITLPSAATPAYDSYHTAQVRSTGGVCFAQLTAASTTAAMRAVDTGGISSGVGGSGQTILFVISYICQ